MGSSPRQWTVDRLHHFLIDPLQFMRLAETLRAVLNPNKTLLASLPPAAGLFFSYQDWDTCSLKAHIGRVIEVAYFLQRC
jgi:hypothetical protein